VAPYVRDLTASEIIELASVSVEEWRTQLMAARAELTNINPTSGQRRDAPVTRQAPPVTRAAESLSPAISACPLPKLDKDTQLHVIGVYESDVYAPFEFKSVDDATLQIDVLIDRTDSPVYIVASAYDPVIWNFALAKGSQLAGVYVIGYHSQAVANVPQDIPVFFNSHDGGGARACGSQQAGYEGGPRLNALNGQLKQIFGKSLDRCQGGYTQSKFVITEATGRQKETSLEVLALTVEGIRAQGTIQKVSLQAGSAGLKQLEEEGAIRPATQADVDEWMTKAAEPYRKLDPNYKPRVRLGGTYFGRTYVVTKQTTLPRDLRGDASANFIVPAGVPNPELLDGTPQMFFVATGGCSGHQEFCRR